MKGLLKKMAFLAGGVAAIMGLGSQPAQASAPDTQAKFEGVTEKSQLVLTQTAYAAGKDFGIQNHYSHSSHASHASHHSHYSGN